MISLPQNAGLSSLREAICTRMGLENTAIQKILQIPDVIMEKDEDVALLTFGDKLEIVL